MTYTKKMDAASNNHEEFAVNFDLFSDNYELLEDTKITASSEDIPEDIVNLINSIHEGEIGQKLNETEVFEEDKTKQRFQVVTPKDLDDLATETNAISTHWQTNWAVNVLRGS